MNTLILVESPIKSRTVAQYARGLFHGAVLVRSTSGHLRDLPKGELGVDTEHGFAPIYQARETSGKLMSSLRALIAQSGRVILATDPDREGEAIAWHITKVFERELEGRETLRATFHAMTREEVRRGLASPRPLDTRLVRSAVARRVIDRLIGYHVSPRLWAEMEGDRHGIGRVQAAALQMVEEESGQWEVKVEL